MSKPKKHKKKHEEHEEEGGSERWLITYGDMLTLLMVLFIVLYAISQVDQKKFNQLKSGLSNGFGKPAVAMAGNQSTDINQYSGTSPMQMMDGVGGTFQKPQTTTEEKTEAQKAAAAAAAAIDRAKQQQAQANAQQEADKYEEVKNAIQKELQKQRTTDSVRFALDERGLIVTIITSSVVFGGDRAELLGDGQKILNAVGPVLAPLPNRIEIDGHTNQLNVDTVNYPSGWELSTARASTVLRYLTSHFGIPENRMFAAGYADTKPLYDPADPRSVTLNRRVEIVVQSTLNATESALLPSAASNELKTGSNQ